MFEALIIFALCSLCGLGLVVVLIIEFFLRRKRKAGHPWRIFAAQTGLTFDEGKGYAKELVTGQYRGRALRLEYITHFNPLGTDSISTRMSLAVKNPSAQKLTVETGAGAGKIGRVFGVAEVKLGDEALDSKYTIRSEPASLASQILLTPSIREQLLGAPYILLALDGEMLLQENRFEMIKDVAALVKTADWLSAVADVLEPVLEKTGQAQ
jgi:hypothetical protein